MISKGNVSLNRLRAVAVRPRSPAAARYIAATAAIGLVAVVQLNLFGASAPWFLYTPAVVLVALFLGGDAGVLATVLSAVLAGYVVVRPDVTFLMTSTHWGASAFFMLTTLGLVGLVVALRYALIEADALRAAREVDLAKLAEREGFLSSVLAASTDCIKVVDLDGALSFMSEGGMQTMEVDDFNAIRGCPWPDLLKTEGVSLAHDAITAAKAGRSSHFEALADTYLGTPKYWSVSVSPIKNAAEEVINILSVSRDHTTIYKARQQQRLLNDELGHRLKNILTLVQSIASQTLRNATSLNDAAASFSARLTALGQATDVLTASSWETATMRSVVDAGLAAAQVKRDRITADGPPINLNSQAALALTLAFHELVTNATKYGALSGDAGTVMLQWRVRMKDEGPLFCLTWQERGGPPVTPPTRQGFGSRMIERSLQSYFSGEAVLTYAAAGVELSVEAPLAAVGALEAIP